jgi:hypothetical protein
MACNPQVLRQVPLFALLDDDETAVLASQVELKRFSVRHRIYKIGDPGGQAYVMVSGTVRITTVDDDGQEVVVDEPAVGEFFGFASMLDGTNHQTNAVALTDAEVIEVDRKDITILLERKPCAGMDLLTVLGKAVPQRAAIGPHPGSAQSQRGDRRGIHAGRTNRRWCRAVRRIVAVHHLACAVVLTVYTAINVTLGKRVGPVPVYPAEPVSLDAGRHPGASHHDEPEPPGHQGPGSQRARFCRESPARRARFRGSRAS